MVSEERGEGQFAIVLERVEGWFKVTADGYQLVNQRLDRLESALNQRIDRLDQKMDLFGRTLIRRMDEGFDKLDARQSRLEERFDSHEQHKV